MLANEKQALSADKGVPLSTSVRESVSLLFDADSFIEFEPNAVSKSTRLNPSPLENPGDGVIAGGGFINCRQVCIAFQDSDVFSGSVGEVHARKIVKALELAVKTGVPFIIVINSKGVRIQEGLDALNGFSQIVSAYTMASGVIPLITVVNGPCTGSAVFIPALSDFVLMVDNSSFVCMNSSLVTKAKTGEDNPDNAIGGADTHGKFTGLSDIKCLDLNDALETVKKLLDYLPDNNLSESPYNENFTFSELSDAIISSGASMDTMDIIKAITDNSEVLELKNEFAPEIITCLAGINGKSVGIVATRPSSGNSNGTISSKAAVKAARFIRFCDAFNIPILSVIDTEGFKPGINEEHSGISLSAGKLAFAYAEATVPKIALVTGKLFGSAYVTLCSRNISADIIYAWSTAEIGVLPTDTAVAILYNDDIANSNNPAARRADLEAEYKNEISGSASASGLGYVDEVINPSETRRKISRALDILSGKRENRPSKKHDNIPL